MHKMCTLHLLTIVSPATMGEGQSGGKFWTVQNLETPHVLIEEDLTSKLFPREWWPSDRWQ